MSTPTFEVDLALLNERLRLYFKVLFLVELSMYLVAVLLVILGVTTPRPPGGDNGFTLVRSAAIVVSGLGWLLCRRWQLGRVALIGLESATTIAFAASYVQLGATLPRYGAAFGILFVSLVVVLRAAVVPSPVSRTLAVSALALAAPVIATALGTEALPNIVVIWLAMVGICFVAVSAVTSRVIYGLRKEVQVAKRLGQYELVRRLGAGGMGVVYEATHVMLRRPTAVKLLPIDKVGEQTVARFEREVTQTSRLEHPNSVYIYDYGRTPDGQFYYAMEYLDGLDLQRLVERTGPLPSGRVRNILLQAARALAEAHDVGLVHRDIKPANIMLCERGGVPDTVKVLDFGLVKELGGADGNVGLTGAETIVGTPHYLAPESISQADAAGPPADVYALGAVGHFLLTAQALFSGDTVIEVCAQHLKDAPRPASEVLGAPVHAELEAVILRCLEKDPSARFADGAALRDALEAVRCEDWQPADAKQWWRLWEQRPSSDAPNQGTRLAVDLVTRA